MEPRATHTPKTWGAQPPPYTISGVKARPVTLSWDGKSSTLAPLAKTAAPLVAALEIDESALYRGDNLAVMRTLARTRSETFTLVYMDPPFLTGRVHEAVSRVDRSSKVAFDDRWVDRASYLEALLPRIAAARGLLAPHGSLVVHVDPKTSHYVKVACDDIFGDDAFASEIVWRYRRWPAKTPNFQRVHDVLLRYRKDPKTPPRFNQQYEPLAPSTQATWGNKQQRAVVGKDGRRVRSSSTLHVSPGVPMGDVWDVGVIAPVSRERTGYPSQKPEALLERIVRALSDEGDWVLDPFAGSGTTLAVAHRLGRRFVGIDASEVAIETACSRLSRSTASALASR